jgi:predicted CoA-binding protein
MATHSPSLETIEAFLAQKRIAMVGVSREPKSFSVTLFEELSKRGYDVVPVNPMSPSVLGHPCFARVQDVQPPVDAVLIMTSPLATDTVVRDCAEAGVRRVWMYRATGQGAVTPTAVAFCRDHGIQLVAGECPFMFLPAAGAVHRLHGFVRKIIGRYPDRHCA